MVSSPSKPLVISEKPSSVLFDGGAIASIAGAFEPPNAETLQGLAAMGEKYPAQITEDLNWAQKRENRLELSRKSPST